MTSIGVNTNVNIYVLGNPANTASQQLDLGTGGLTDYLSANTGYGYNTQTQPQNGTPNYFSADYGANPAGLMDFLKGFKDLLSVFSELLKLQYEKPEVEEPEEEKPEEPQAKRPDFDQEITPWEIKRNDWNNHDSFLKGMYKNVLGRDGEEAGLKHWADAMAKGKTHGDVMEGFLNSEEFKAKYPDATAEDKLKLVYRQMTGKDPSAEQLASAKDKSIKDLTNELKNQRVGDFIKTLPQAEQDQLKKFFEAISTEEGKKNWENFLKLTPEEQAALAEAGKKQEETKKQEEVNQYLRTLSDALNEGNEDKVTALLGDDRNKAKELIAQRKAENQAA